MDLGGTREGNAASTIDAIPKVLEFLRTSLGAGAAAPVTAVTASAGAAH